MPKTVADMGEFGLIAAISERLSQTERVLLGPGDDVSVVATPDGRVVAATDLLVENRHFRRDWSSARDIGHKAAAQNLADIVAMGAEPTALLFGLGAPADLPAPWVMELVDGLREESEPLGASIIGGDTVGSDVVIVAITALGDLGGRDPVTRSGAAAGDVVAVCGRLGWAAAGLQVLSRGFRSPRRLVEAHQRPQVPYDAAREAVELGVSAMCDVSDGLLADVGHIADHSQVSIDVDPDSFDVAALLRDVASAVGGDPMHWVLNGGDDNALVATFRPDVVLPDRWRVIGRVSAGQGVTVAGQPFAGPAGHTHFGEDETGRRPGLSG